MTPSQLPNHLVTVHENLSDFHAVITTCNVKIPQTDRKSRRTFLLKIEYVFANRASLSCLSNQTDPTGVYGHYLDVDLK